MHLLAKVDGNTKLQTVNICSYQWTAAL